METLTCLDAPGERALRNKRRLDVLLLVLLGPLLLLLASVSVLLVRICTGGPALFRQERIGLHGRVFKIWKIRTMRLEAERILEEHLSRDSSAREEWTRFLKLRDDPRVIPYIGNFLRRTSLDECPQILNVLSGEMSFVGPRPLPVYHFGQLDPRFQSLRQSVPPGLTGLWQIKERSDGDLQSHQKWDLIYIEKLSLANDLSILVKTPLVVLRGRGAV